MPRIFSNGPSRDFVQNPFENLLAQSQRIHIASPYVTVTEPLALASRLGKSIDLLVGLNAATSPQALRAVHGLPNIAIRYLTYRFHAKIFLYDNAALVGSSNLTDGGLLANREATLVLDQPEDVETIDELRALFFELWEAARVLTNEKLQDFATAHAAMRRSGPDPDTLIENAVGRAEPSNINVASRTRTTERLFLEDLRRQVYEQYRPAFSEVTRLLLENQLRRGELEDEGTAHETNRFLNWVRLTYAPGEDTWRNAPLRPQSERRDEILRLAREWATTQEHRIPTDFVEWLRTVKRVFAPAESVADAPKERITEGLLCLHAFAEQLRFVKGGLPNLPAAFWKANNDNVRKVRQTLAYLVHGNGDFIQRLHDILYEPRMKLAYFGKFCALELYGTVKPDECPPMNGRIAKGLRFLGFDVRGS